MMSIIRSMIKTRRCFSRKQKFRERDEKPTNFPLLLLLLCLSFYVVDRQPTTKEEREILSSSSLSLSLSSVYRREDEKKSRRRQTRSCCFSHEAVAYYSQSSFELRRAFEFYSAPSCCPLFSLSKIAAFPSFVVVVVERDEMREKEVHTRAS